MGKSRRKNLQKLICVHPLQCAPKWLLTNENKVRFPHSTCKVYFSHFIGLLVLHDIQRLICKLVIQQYDLVREKLVEIVSNVVPGWPLLPFYDRAKPQTDISTWNSFPSKGHWTTNVVCGRMTTLSYSADVTTLCALDAEVF